MLNSTTLNVSHATIHISGPRQWYQPMQILPCSKHAYRAMKMGQGTVEMYHGTVRMARGRANGALRPRTNVHSAANMHELSLLTL